VVFVPIVVIIVAATPFHLIWGKNNEIFRPGDD
jgi:hypothetical protein